MPKYINFEAREHYEKSITRTKPQAKKFSEATGERTTKRFTGPWEALESLGEAFLSDTHESQSVTYELEREGGNFCSLRLTWERYRVPEDSEGEEGEDDPTGESSPGDSEDDPAYTTSSTMVPVPLLTFPAFKDIAGDELRALKAMLDGRDENELLDDETGTGGKKIKDFITTDAGKKAFDYFRRGQFQFYDSQTEATARWKGRSNPYTVAKIETPPGNIRAEQGRNWLCSGAGVEKHGATTWCTASFRMSGPAGWDSFLYR